MVRIMTELDRISPAWAWSPFQGDEKHPDLPQMWGRKLAAHLHRRAGFGASTSEVSATASLSPADAVEKLVNGTEPPAATKEFDQLVDAGVATGDSQQLSAGWLYRMRFTSAPLLEKQTLFLHGLFATSAAKVANAAAMLTQNRLLREHALGDFRALTHRIARDPAMLVYLDSTENRKTHPNENFARELMELFCLGPGNYTEKDIQELARCFTGWELRRNHFRINKYQHDSGIKTVFNKSGAFDGDAGIDLVLNQEAAPRFIVRKLIRFYLFDEPEVPDAFVDPLAKQLRKDRWNLSGVVQRILSSNLCFSRYSLARKVRSPIELAVGLMRGLEGSSNMLELANQIESIGQRPFYPPNVKGWDGGRTWLNSATLLGRAELVRKLTRQDAEQFGERGLAGVASRADADSPTDLVPWLSDLLLATELPKTVTEELHKLIATGSPNHSQIGELVQGLAMTPEFQLS